MNRSEREGGGMNWYLEGLRKYGVFGGRARRKEYWYFVLFNIIISIVLAVIDVATGSFSAEVLAAVQNYTQVAIENVARSF